MQREQGGSALTLCPQCKYIWRICDTFIPPLGPQGMQALSLSLSGRKTTTLWPNLLYFHSFDLVIKVAICTRVNERPTCKSCARIVCKSRWLNAQIHTADTHRHMRESTRRRRGKNKVLRAAYQSLLSIWSFYCLLISLNQHCLISTWISKRVRHYRVGQFKLIFWSFYNLLFIFFMDKF